MQFHLFQYPLPFEGGLDDLNQFLSSHRVVSVNREIVISNGNSLLVFTVETISGESQEKEKAKSKPRVDYREHLADTEYALFNLLRDERKKLADGDSVPVFGVFNNAQLAEMVTQNATTLSNIANIKGVGEARGNKYGQAMSNILLKQS